MYAPRFARHVHLVLFDCHRLLGLTRRSVDAPLTLPTVSIHGGDTYLDATEQFLRAHLPRSAWRWGNVVGHLLAPLPCGNEKRNEARVLTVHVEGPGDPNGGMEWQHYPNALDMARNHCVPDLDVFIEGYLGGWIPDGWITLD